ncbi:hypothetical protein BD779DRAFT_1496677 [Infundibulicybe gibba]|nr:hypothetical protein BD779DRAFT_1496677 [Infundibulicybe gibba]
MDSTTTTTGSQLPLSAYRDPTDAFFGYTFASSRTHESRHDRRISEVLPPYTEDLPPTYTEKAEHITLAMYLFKFGFLFPPFWVMGAFIMMSPLRAPPSTPSSAWLPEKTEEEREAIIATLRAAELKWARRCLWALIVFIMIAVSAGVGAWAVVRSRS